MKADLKACLLLSAVLAAVPGCGSAPAPSTTAATCVAGAQVACACPGGGQGAQTCQADGKGLGACAACTAGADATVADSTLPGIDAVGGADNVMDAPAADQAAPTDAPDAAAQDVGKQDSDGGQGIDDTSTDLIAVDIVPAPDEVAPPDLVDVTAQDIGSDVAVEDVGLDAAVPDVTVPDVLALDAGFDAVDVSTGPDVPSACTNGLLDGLETATDCGGPLCLACVSGKACVLGTDCQSTVCTNKVCQAATGCSNGTKDSLETDMDCGGGACPACPDGKACLVQTDCTDNSCVNGTCSAAATCTDGKKNAAETDADCGGPICKKCADGSKCLVAADCASTDCSGGTCGAGGGCGDGVTDGKESDIDCGGGTCKLCQSGQHCNAGTDCTSKLCVNTLCTAPSCSDQVKNGLETDLDCGGGGDCVPCAIGQQCKGAPDCLSQLCFNGLCKVQPTCIDGIKNGNETGKDCGGSQCSACKPGQTCLAAKDCNGGACKNNVCQQLVCTDLATCDDANQCTTDACDPMAGCSHIAIAVGKACDLDASKCTTDLCGASVCMAGAPKLCDDKKLCTTDACDAKTGLCVYTIVTDGVGCDDGNACTAGDACAAGACTSGSPKVCDDGNQCTADTCSKSAGCVYTSAVEGSPCDLDGTKCTPDTCAAGVCQAIAAANCDDTNACTTDGCDPATGACTHAKLPDNSPCDDGAVCTVGDACMAGTCKPGPCTGAPAVVGCADGSREGFSDLKLFPSLAACGGAWDQPGIFAMPTKCDRAAGNDGKNAAGIGCTVSDLCTVGWHVCTGKADVVGHNPAGCEGVMTGAASPVFFTSQMSSTGAFECKSGADATNDLFGCGNLGCDYSSNVTVKAMCAPLSMSSQDLCKGLRNDLGGPAWCNHLGKYPGLPNSWDCGTDATKEAVNVKKTHAEQQGGVLCCLD